MKTKCSCGDLYISDTYGASDFICDRDGKLCDGADYIKECFIITTPLNCEHHKEIKIDNVEEL